ncbi:MAG: 2-(1,2-epoxy,2-dihydrophenyl)acetyl-CoA isomerase [Acidobacteriota bacterium]|jgi:2-(1,2-epoxy-1,2-dihydrophenyl)acetyl-CoA isomerase|nr:2-(1,2-epoxy,2-dihydrophenyl)acetyl-CoA isomerase [Acidobacteriota bacterium]
MYENIKVDFDGGIATITLNRPEKLNAFAGHMRRDLAESLEHAGSDPEVRVVVLTGAGRAFSTGADVRRMSELMEAADMEEFKRLLGAGRRVLTAIRQMLKPVVAAVNGPAYGAGFNLALACDLRLAAESATFSQSFVKVGLHPDWGGSFFLPRVVPSNIACEMFFLGDAIDAQRALQLSLVNRVVADDALATETRKLAERLRNAPQAAVAAAKRAVYMSEQENLERMLQYETEAQLQCFQSREARERVRAFLERRAPRLEKNA